MTLTVSVPLRPVCHHPGCNQPPHTVGGLGETADWCVSHLADIQTIRAKLIARANAMPHRGSPIIERPLGVIVTRPVVTCGTNAGYHRHRRRHEPACADCLSAHVKDGSGRKAGYAA